MGVLKEDVQDLLDPNMTDITMNYMAKSNPMWKLIAKEQTTDRLNSEVSMISGLTMADEVGDYDPPVEKKMVQGYSVSQRQRKFSYDVVIPESTWRFASDPESLLASLEPQGETMVRPINARIDNLVCDIIANAETTTGPDSVYFASASHTRPNSSSTWSNYLASGSARPLQESYVEDMITLINQCPDLVGEPAELLMTNKCRLLVSPTNSSLAMRITKSIGLQGTANNDMNPLGEMGLQSEPIVWPRLDSNFDGLDNNDWYLIFEQMPVLVIWGLLPEFKSRMDNDDNYHFTGKFWVDVKPLEPRGLWFADGS